MRCWRRTEVDLGHLTCNTGRLNLSKLILILSKFHNSFLKSYSLISLVMDNSQWNNSDISFYNRFYSINQTHFIAPEKKKGYLKCRKCWPGFSVLLCTHIRTLTNTYTHTHTWTPTSNKMHPKNLAKNWLLWGSKWYSSYQFSFLM